jgi:hypothetical protein
MALAAAPPAAAAAALAATGEAQGAVPMVIDVSNIVGSDVSVVVSVSSADSEPSSSSSCGSDSSFSPGPHWPKRKRAETPRPGRK